MKYFFLLLLCCGCKIDTFITNYQFDDLSNKKCVLVNWDSVPTNESSDSGYVMLKRIIGPVAVISKEKQIPISVLLAFALYRTSDGYDYFPETQNAFNIDCVDQKCNSETHCLRLCGQRWGGRRIRKFQNIENSVRFWANILIRQYDARGLNAYYFMNGLALSNNFVGELNYDLIPVCSYMKTYNLFKYDKI